MTEVCKPLRFRSRRMNDTVSGVLAGVVPNTVAPGSSAASIPDDTFSGVFGLGVEAIAGPASAVSGAMTCRHSQHYPRR